jgi:hypothetical protein
MIVDKQEHDCETEYRRHCLRCVAGDSDAEIKELSHDSDGRCVRARIIYRGRGRFGIADGSMTELVLTDVGWDFAFGYGVVFPFVVNRREGT